MSSPISKNWPVFADRRSRPRGEDPRILPAIRRAGVPAATDRRAEGVLHRSPVQGGRESGNGRQAGRALGPQVAPVPLPRDRAATSPDGYDVASRLSFGLWDSLPDQPLLDAAAAGQLATREQVARQAERMVTDLRARSKLREFLLQWLKVDQAPEIAKDPKRISRSSTRLIVSDLRTSLDLFLEDVIGSETARFPPAPPGGLRLPQRPAGAVLRRRSAADAPFQKVQLEPQRACRGADAPLPDGEFRLHGDELADPSRRLYSPECPGPGTPATARSRRPACPRSPPRSDDPPARDASDQARIVPVVPRHDQSSRIYPGAFRRRRPIPKR